MFPIPSAGGAPFSPTSQKVIRLLRKGCANRPFFHISVMEKKTETHDPVIEQLGVYDPLINKYNEKLVGINYKRVEHWLREGATCTVPVLKLLGLSGYFPIHPESIEEAWNNRKKIKARLEELRTQVASFSKVEEYKSPEPASSAEGGSEADPPSEPPQSSPNQESTS